MKKLLLLTFLVTFSITHAQEELNLDYNKWSLEIAGGFHKPTRYFADGYYTETPSFGQFSLGARYMFNDRFGLKLDFGYSTLKEGKSSLPFQGDYYRSSLQGVANLGSILRFEEWTNTIGLLAHAGGGYSMLSPQKPIELDKNDGMVNVIVGISPQIRLGNSVAFTTDVSLIGHVGQNHTWDGTQSSSIRGFDGMLMNFSAGLTFYLGKNEKHADWFTQKAMLDNILEDHENRISKIETDLIDSDQDGVPDYLDREPNTPSGVTVDTKGRAIDLNKNGIPDEMEAGLDARYLKKEEAAALAGGSTTVEELLNKGYVNVYFRFNSDKPETYSLDAINYLVKYMKDHPSAKAELVGFADEIGNPQYNQALSERRAKRVYDILLATGVSADRLTYRGGGEDTSVDKDSSPARQLVRRVTFRLK
ncbi:MAG: OmpA family protein [Aequorivita sp.]